MFAAWLNHDDSRSLNTQDMFVAGEGGGYVRHHLIDFSSTLGSGSNAQREIAPQNPRAGNEYIIELAPMLRTLFSLGLWERPWRKVHYPEHPGVGRIEADFFQPDAWRPEYPNPAFERMQDEDAFWAAAIVHEFSDEAVRAAVATGELGNAESERYLADTLIRRRDKTVAHYFARMNPLAWFAVEDGALRFRNLGEEAGLGRADGVRRGVVGVRQRDRRARALEAHERRAGSRSHSRTAPPPTSRRGSARAPRPARPGPGR